MTMTDPTYDEPDDTQLTASELAWLHGQPEPPTWQYTDLSDPALDVPPEPPAIHGLLYAGKRHVLSGAPESAKTLIAYTLLLEAQREGQVCAIVDFEMGAYAARRLLADLGATPTELRELMYVEPDGPPTANDIRKIVAEGVGYTLIDAAAGAYDATGLDDNARKDVEQFARRWIRPLFQQGVSTIIVDHVTKNVDTRGKFAIGSERKAGTADIHLGLEAIKTLTRGTTGLVKVTVHKDRPGYLERPTACYFELQSDPETHLIAWHIRPHDEPDETGIMRPTVLMERVSKYLELQSEPCSRNNVETEVKGKRAEWIRKALDVLIREGYATEEIGSRGARLVALTRPYRESTDPKNTTSSDLVPVRPGRTDLTSSDDVPPHGDGDEVKPSPEDDLVPDELDVHDPAVQALLDDTNDIPF